MMAQIKESERLEQQKKLENTIKELSDRETLMVTLTQVSDNFLINRFLGAMKLQLSVIS